MSIYRHLSVSVTMGLPVVNRDFRTVWYRSENAVHRCSDAPGGCADVLVVSMTRAVNRQVGE
jgi:hypothetical protein